jgi:environmental stress-induced protein Ves
MEIAAGPLGSATDGAAAAADWTLSIATIASDVAFSSFPGVARWLMALSEGGLRLVIDGEALELKRWEVVTFDGASDVASTGVKHPTLDLNLMVARERWHGSLDFHVVDGAAAISPRPASETIVVLLDGAVSVDGPGFDGSGLDLHDALRLGSDPLSLTGDAAVAIARISPRV